MIGINAPGKGEALGVGDTVGVMVGVAVTVAVGVVVGVAVNVGVGVTVAVTVTVLVTVVEICEVGKASPGAGGWGVTSRPVGYGVCELTGSLSAGVISPCNATSL
jgi:hypothetical protein